MPESTEHADLVDILHRYMADRFSNGDLAQVLADSARSEFAGRPPRVEGFIPDVYFLSSAGSRVAIGEAKSMRDLENSHTEEQLAAFLRRCATAAGSTFVLAVPWPLERLAVAMLRDIWTREQATDVPIELLVLSDANPMGTDASPKATTQCRS